MKEFIAQEEEERESMRILRELALEIQQMDEIERLRTLEWVVQKESKKDTNRCWLLVVKVLLAEPELIPRALKLAEERLNASAKGPAFNMRPVVSDASIPHSKNFLPSFFHIFSEG